ncbi:unnamed protein product [Pleuronectes platessa]|uniref:Immunoglobulin V-set domain-containing protein n=1 Tax=Pleuronectes platessa TaxID=8262 RepID=A0A9N7Z5A4_PLEPL|nr:unnamed protein product [Pleuronectes platessa]
MRIRFLFCTFLTGISLGIQVDQSPSALFKRAGDDVQLVCTHDRSEFRVMLWYQQSPGEEALKIIARQLLTSIITVICIKGVYLCDESQVCQMPSELLVKPNREVNLSLSHQNPRYDTILWYQRSAGDSSLKLIGSVNYKFLKIQSLFVGHFEVSGNGEKQAFLHIKKPRHPEDSGEYFGAASVHSYKDEDAVVHETSITIQQIPAHRL